MLSSLFFLRIFFHLVNHYIKVQVFFVFSFLLHLSIVSIFYKNFESITVEAYGEITDWLITNSFSFSSEESGLGGVFMFDLYLEDPILIWSSWGTIPHIYHHNQSKYIRSILSIFYPIVRKEVDCMSSCGFTCRCHGILSSRIPTATNFLGYNDSQECLSPSSRIIRSI